MIHIVCMYVTHTLTHDTHCLYVCTLQLLLTWSPLGNYNIIIQYSCLPVLHLLPVHPGSQTQVSGLLQTPFSQGGTQTAKERTGSRVNCKREGGCLLGPILDPPLLVCVYSGHNSRRMYDSLKYCGRH